MISSWTFYLAISWLLIGIRADGNVGCLLSKRVCGKHEWCYDDFAFGRCLPLHEKISTDDLYRYGLEKDALSQLEHEIRRLFTAGYRWAHSYTQCIIKKILQSFRYKVNFERNKCESKQDEDLERALKYLEAEHELDPSDIAIIKFQPSLFDPKADYGDELFFPSGNSHHASVEEDDSYVGVVKKYPGLDEALATKDGSYEPKSKLHSYRRRKKAHPEHYDNKPLSDSELLDLLQIMSYAKDDEDFTDFIDYPDEAKLDEPQSLSYANTRNLNNDGLNPMSRNDDRFERDYEARNFIDATEALHLDPTVAFERPHRYDVKKPGPYFKVNNYVFEKEEQENQKKLSSEPVNFKFHPLFEEEDPSAASIRHQHLFDEPAEDFTAEAMSIPVTEIKTPYDENHDSSEITNMENDFNDNDSPVFLNVGKDDYFSPDDELSEFFADDIDNDYSEDVLHNLDHFNAELNRYRKNSLLQSVNNNLNDDSWFSTPDFMKSDEKEKSSKYQNFIEWRQKPGDKFPAILVTKNEPIPVESFGSEEKMRSATHDSLVAPEISDSKKKSVIVTPSIDADHYDIVDTSYTYIVVDKDFHSLKEGKDYVETLLDLLNLPNKTFSNIRQIGNKVTFKVTNDKINASVVASKAESLKNELYQRTGKMLTSAGIGFKTQFSVEELQNDNRIFIVTFIVCGVIAGAVIAVGVLYVVRRHARSREKLQNLTQLDTEASQDYQDLCRQRMASKNTEKPEPIHVAQRISSLSRDSEASVRSPSSRSSTSSWNEEPVISNMDISTGHMVLSYMEDHLTNKDRLDQEWVALCAYEADPAVVDAATQPNNIKKNRYEGILPYDHSRVVLNDLTNIAGSDYINASTITDHDPRNPAYIATQGPLPHTSADFWQMIWEQGSVVIVMLTRLVENGVAMCHRYWPEEGSELYHIYEVHLVSEHIWCEDYLVRSFYLKNLKTGETRTVTQFHFLSWLDNGVPSSTKALLDFRRKVNKSYRGRSCPIVVHCSDGSGRTGTYCLIDMVLNRMAKGAKEIDIAATLEHIRDQRTGMVRTKAQFEFALMAVAEEVHAILKAMPQ